MFKLVVLWASLSLSLADDVTYVKDIRPLFKERCSVCHDSMAGRDWQDRKTAYEARFKIKNRVFTLKDMPQANVTGMTGEEREEVKNWVEHGAK